MNEVVYCVFAEPPGEPSFRLQAIYTSREKALERARAMQGVKVDSLSRRGVRSTSTTRNLEVEDVPL